jgi:oligoendopeptidase F
MAAKDDRHRWDLRDIYPDTEAWETALERIQEGIEAIQAFRGSLGSSPQTLQQCLDQHFSVLKEMYRASSYASMRYHEDTRVGVTAGMEQRASLVATRLSEAARFIEPEILSLGCDIPSSAGRHYSPGRSHS